MKSKDFLLQEITLPEFIIFLNEILKRFIELERREKTKESKGFQILNSQNLSVSLLFVFINVIIIKRKITNSLFSNMTSQFTLAQTRQLVAESLMEQISALSAIKQKCFSAMPLQQSSLKNNFK